MRRRPSRLLGWIITFKAAKAVTLLALSMALLTTRHSDPVDRFLRLTLAVHLPLSARLLDRAITPLSTLTIAARTICTFADRVEPTATTIVPD